MVFETTTRGKEHKIPYLVDLQTESSPESLAINARSKTSRTILVSLQQRSHPRTDGGAQRSGDPLIRVTSCFSFNLSSPPSKIVAKPFDFVQICDDVTEFFDDR